jgi:hypothetical protein
MRELNRGKRSLKMWATFVIKKLSKVSYRQMGQKLFANQKYHLGYILEGLSTEIVGIHMYFQPIGNIL